MMLYVNRHPFNNQPNRQRSEMAAFVEKEVLGLLLTRQEDIDDVQTLVEVLREKAALINAAYPRQKAIRIHDYEHVGGQYGGGYIYIDVGNDEYRDKVGLISLSVVEAITNKKFFAELRERMQEGGAR